MWRANDIHCIAQYYSIPISVSIHNPSLPFWRWVDQLNRTLQSFPPFLHNAVCNFHTWHSPRVVCSRVPVCNISNHLQPQLSGIQHLPKRLQGKRNATWLNYSDYQLSIVCTSFDEVEVSTWSKFCHFTPGRWKLLHIIKCLSTQEGAWRSWLHSHDHCCPLTHSYDSGAQTELSGGLMVFHWPPLLASTIIGSAWHNTCACIKKRKL